MKKGLKYTLIILIIGIFGFSIYLSFFNEPTPEDKLFDCKIKAWEDCGLIIYGNESFMCYQIENKTSDRWEECQIVSQKVSDCWRIGRTKCEEKYDPSQNKSLTENSEP